MPGMRLHLAVASFAFAFAVASPAAAQGPTGNHEADHGVSSMARTASAVTREDLEVITAEISRLRAEVAALRNELSEVKRPRDHRLATPEPQNLRTSEPF